MTTRLKHKESWQFGEWLIIAQHSHDELDITTLERPKYVYGHRTPETLDEMTLGQMLAISSAEGGDMFFTICREFFGMSDRDTMHARAVDVVAFCGWVSKQISDISKLFEAVRMPHTSQEIRAGINDLNHGVFGLIDWYARRMGIADHDLVLCTHWGRVFKCLQIDNETAMYQRRLNDIITNDSKLKTNGKR